MRVLHVVDSHQFRGAEMFAADLIRALRESGVSQRVAVLREHEGRGVSYGAPNHTFGSDGFTIPGLRIRPRALLALRALISRWRPDFVQAHGGDTLKYTIPAAITRRTSVVYRKIGPTPRDVISGFKRAGHGQLMRRAARVIAVADAVRKEAVEAFHVPSGRVVTIPNAVDPRRLSATREPNDTRLALGIAPTSPVILSLGALTWEKDPVAHVDIGARVLREHPEVTHLMVGDGPLRGQVDAAIRQQGLDGRIRLLPARADVPDLLTVSKVLLLASHTEGMPGCLIEAGMMGLPVAAYAIAGVPEVVVDRVTGCLTPPGDRQALAESVLELLENPETSRSMGEAAREYCRSRFEINVIARMYLELYEELAA